MKSDVYLTSKKLQCFSNNEILDLIDNETMKEIKSKDNNPYFQAYSIAHEGYSRPTVLGMGGKLIKWSRQSIQSIKNAIKKGTKFFYRHNKDNSTVNRDIIGEIVGYGEKMIDGILNAVAIGYFPQDKKEFAKTLDICSHEGSWNFNQIDDNELIAEDCCDITAVALSNSSIEQPAFSGTKQLALIQCMSDITGAKPDNQINKNNGANPMEVTFNDVQNFIRDRQVWPSQLFKFDKIKQDHEFSEYFKEVETKNKTVSEELEKFKTENKTLAETLDKTKSETLKLTVKTRFDNLLKASDIKLTELEKSFIVKSLETIKDPTDEGLKNFVESKQNDYRIIQELRNEKPKDLETSKNSENKDDTIDYTDPSKNDLI